MHIEKFLWFDFENAEASAVALGHVFNLAFTTIYLSAPNVERFLALNPPRRLNLAVRVSSMDEWEVLSASDEASRFTHVFCDELDLVRRIRAVSAVKLGMSFRVDDGATMERVVAFAPELDVAIIDFKDPTNIPLELILASTQRSETRVLKKVRSADDGEVSLMTMESGSDGLLVATADIEHLSRISATTTASKRFTLPLKPAKVVSLQHAGMGTRVCIDTTSELTADEGMVLGSTSSGGLVTCSETHFLPYMDLRPFRVNAGALHLYVWGPDRVRYLSDLRAGHEVFVVDSKGQARVVTIGRLKIERRPMLKIEADVEGVRLNTFIQDDWHVRMFGSEGEIRPSAEIHVGDRLLAHLDRPGRHVGIAIEETILEV
ncbi:MAG: hypothetical protein JWN04_1413 [Myxococcaceae bacterium]|nr:hypothetical protein [Myxococcaceae bacterium]